MEYRTVCHVRTNCSSHLSRSNMHRSLRALADERFTSAEDVHMYVHMRIAVHHLMHEQLHLNYA